MRRPKLPKLLFGSTHPTYHFLMLLIASGCLGLCIYIAFKVSTL